MSLGELPVRTSMRGYWKLEDENDSSGNGLTLTNRNTVTFSAGKFNNASDFGSSGTNKGLTLSSNPTSGNKPQSLTFSCWFKLNTTGSANGSARFFELLTNTGTPSSGSLINGYYNITGGTLHLTCAVRYTTTSATSIKTGLTLDLNWHSFIFTRNGVNTLLYYDGLAIGTNTAGVGTEQGIAGTYNFTIGNNRFLTASAWAKIDDFILEERIWSASEIVKYYTQAKGRFAI